MKKLDRLLHKMRPDPADMFQLEYNLNVLTGNELCWLVDYIENSIAGDDGSAQDQQYFESLVGKAREGAVSNGTAQKT